ncbi:hypothetical protein EYR40_005312 [Pleurotus pulmonarius]|nr:hypothetical protein EYR40_005312 [Pleurotus pulmonarius]
MATTQNNATAQSSALNSNRDQNISFPPLTAEEEDHVILTRITNDERPLRRVIKKFHAYTSIAFQTGRSAQAEVAVDDAREAFLVELSSFHLMLKKSVMICEGEVRQVEEYQRERLRIEDEHGTLKGQIEQLKTSLEHAQLQRRRKLEYDAIAEKVNMLPSREELEQSIQALEGDMAAIKSEHDSQDRIIRNQKSALDSIIANLGSLRFTGKDIDMASASVVNTPRVSPGPDEGRETVDSAGTGRESSRGEASMSLDIKEEKEEGETFSDNNRVDSYPAEGQITRTEGSETGQNDIEMGEVEEDNSNLGKGSKVKRIREELEEGEASDESSELSDAPE